MWNEVDKELKNYDKFYKNNQRNTIDEIENAFNRIDDIEKDATRNDLKAFQRRITNNYEYLTDYGKYQANKYLKRRRIKYRDMFWFDLFLIYAYANYKLLKEEYRIAELIALDTFNKELESFNIKKKLDFDKIMLSPNSKGYVWNEYKDAMIEYNVNEVYSQAIQNIRANKPLNVSAPEFQKIFNRQHKRMININGDKTSGAMDNQLIYVANSSKIQAYEYAGIDKCKFIAVEDKATTKMCRSLDGQIFNIHDWNVFYRYSATNEANKRYRVYGMIPGVNLPPIDDNYHYCRSTIIYQLGNDLDTRVKLGKRARETTKRQEEIRNARI